MTSNYHTPIPTGAAANAQTFNDPLGQMDEALSEALLLERDGHIIQDEGVDLAQKARLDFVGAGVMVTDELTKTKVTIPGGGVPSGYLFGLTLSNNGTDPTNDIDIAAGTAKDSTNAYDLTLASALTKRLDAAWTVGTNQGGLDTGSIANTTYHIWLIKRSDTGVVDVLFSTSALSPTMPTNYDYKRRIGSIIRSAGSILGFVQNGDRFMLKSPIQNVSVTNPGTAAVIRTLSVPVGIRVLAIIFVIGYGTSSSADPQAIRISDLSLDDVIQTSINLYSDYSGLLQVGAIVEVYTNTSAQVRSRVQVSTAGTGLVIGTHGWVDDRGRSA